MRSAVALSLLLLLTCSCSAVRYTLKPVGDNDTHYSIEFLRCDGKIDRIESRNATFNAKFDNDTLKEIQVFQQKPKRSVIYVALDALASAFRALASII